MKVPMSFRGRSLVTTKPQKQTTTTSNNTAAANSANENELRTLQQELYPIFSRLTVIVLS
jgi:hypothetical protein